ncbi:hypothetical protein BC937DRAFT_95259 [Endogone sp. FLAS-F59071]|nr:hypothetical protein BC937DRAFT_95259 [Endogone sp. FLAS-F59071]|eukprot:RUS20421.1 hypothetical protein BC937DRAFT_95259 [Endogone sp. FLAS-F59071]
MCMGVSLILTHTCSVGCDIDEMNYKRHFNEWFEDVHTEFSKFGRLVQFKVCRNHSSHLRGNLYIQYATETAAAAALEATQGRWFGGRQLTCEYVPLTKWKVAICGQFDRGQCPKLKLCNYLHPYRNPGGLYRDADRDFEQIPNATIERRSAAMIAAAAAAATAALQKVETESNDAPQSTVIHTEKPLHPDFQPTKQTDSDAKAHRGENVRHRRRNSESGRPEGDNGRNWSSSRRHHVRDRDFGQSKERYYDSWQRSPNRGNHERGERHCDHHDRHRSKRRGRSRERDDRKVKQRSWKFKSATDDRKSSQPSVSPEYRPQSPPGLDEEKAGKAVKVDTVAERKLD